MAGFATLLLGLASAGMVAEGSDCGEDCHPIDSARSRAEFEVSVLLLLKLRGEFTDFSGSLRIDHGAGTATVEARIATASVHMDRKDYADWLRSEEFFDAARHPEVRFSSDPFPLALLTTGGDIKGELEIRGVTRPQRLRIDSEPCAESPCPLRAEGSLRRRQFGMVTRRAVSDRVKISFEITPGQALPISP